MRGVAGRRGAAVGLAVLLGVAACSSGGQAASTTPSPTPSASAAPSSPGPAPTQWLADLVADGTTLYVASHDCPGRVVAGTCTVEVKLGGGLQDFKARPLDLWRYDGERWTDLGRPGVFSRVQMRALPGGLLFVPQAGDPSLGGQSTGPLRVSLDQGATWEDWPIPDQRRRCVPDYSGPGAGPCTVAVAGDDVVVASNYGWVRRRIGTEGWVDITPPKRARIDEIDSGGYGVLALPDGTLVATVNTFSGNDGSYRVSRDAGATWSAPHRNPGDASVVERVQGSAVLATCWTTAAAPQECGQYRTTDLETWTKEPVDVRDLYENHGPGSCWRVEELDREGRRTTVRNAQAGEVVYAVNAVPYVKGREATSTTLRYLDAPHQAGRVLERSSDGCRTWEQLTGTVRR